MTFTLQNPTTNPIFEMVERQTESAEGRLAKLWHEMEETTTRHQGEAIAAAPRRPSELMTSCTIIVTKPNADANDP